MARKVILSLPRMVLIGSISHSEILYWVNVFSPIITGSESKIVADPAHPKPEAARLGRTTAPVPAL